MRGDPRLEIGGIARAHGIRGEVVVHTHDPDSEILSEVKQVWIGGVSYTVLEARGTHRGWLVLLEGVTTRNEAELLKTKVVEVEREAVEMSDGDVLLDDLIGCKVVLPNGQPWGEITAIELGAGHDLLVIRDLDVERLLPLVDVFVTNIDVEAGIVTVDPPEGLPEMTLTRS